MASRGPQVELGGEEVKEDERKSNVGKVKLLIIIKHNIGGSASCH